VDQYYRPAARPNNFRKIRRSGQDVAIVPLPRDIVAADGIGQPPVAQAAPPIPPRQPGRRVHAPVTGDSTTLGTVAQWVGAAAAALVLLLVDWRRGAV
jgi:hypothetical protein